MTPKMEVVSREEIYFMECDDELMNPREAYTGLQRLADSVREHGLVKPIPVGTKNSKGYPAFGGHRRLMAIDRHIPEMTEIPVLVFPVRSRAEVMEYMLVDNSFSVDLKPTEVARHVVHMMLEDRMTPERIAASSDFFGSPAGVADYAALHEAPESIKRDVNSGAMSWSAWRRLARKPKATQEKVAERLEELEREAGERPTVQRVQTAVKKAEEGDAAVERMIEDRAIVDRLNEALDIVRSFRGAMPLPDNVKIQAQNRLSELSMQVLGAIQNLDSRPGEWVCYIGEPGETDVEFEFRRLTGGVVAEKWKGKASSDQLVKVLAAAGFLAFVGSEASEADNRWVEELAA